MAEWFKGVSGRCVALVLALTFGMLVLAPPQLQAALVQSRLADGQLAGERASDLERVRQVLEREVVVQRLADFGFTKDEALAKIASATDAQLHQLASLSDDLAAGADGLGVVVTLLVIVLLIVVILKLSDKQIIIR